MLFLLASSSCSIVLPDNASEEAADQSPASENTNTRAEQAPPSHSNEQNKLPAQEHNTDQHTESQAHVSEKESHDNNTTEPPPKSRTKGRTTLRKSLSPTRARTKIEPEEGMQEDSTANTDKYALALMEGVTNAVAGLAALKTTSRLRPSKALPQRQRAHEDVARARAK